MSKLHYFKMKKQTNIKHHVISGKNTSKHLKWKRKQQKADDQEVLKLLVSHNSAHVLLACLFLYKTALKVRAETKIERRSCGQIIVHTWSVAFL